ILNTHNRYYNLIGNVLGTAGYHSSYTMSPPTAANQSTCWRSIYALGWGGNCTTGSMASDALVATTLMRWGNYDVVTGTVKFDSTEVPAALSKYNNLIPVNQNLPASFYLATRPVFFNTTSGTVAWPPIGPDVT